VGKREINCDIFERELQFGLIRAVLFAIAPLTSHTLYPSPYNRTQMLTTSRAFFLAASMVAISTAPAIAQDPSVAVRGAQYLIRVRVTDTTKQATMHIAIAGRAFGSLGASKGSVGSVSLRGDGGTGTGTVVGSLLPQPGQLTFSSDKAGVALELIVTAVDGARTPMLSARGTTVSVTYSAAGGIGVEARR
jgi:hypothetical protein